MLTAAIFDGTEFRFANRHYAVSKRGEVLRKTLKGISRYTPQVRNDGYLVAGHVDRVTGLVHRLVALVWLEKPVGANLVHHKDGNKANNDADNLEWVTPKQHISEKHPDTIGRHVVTESARLAMRNSRLGKKDSEETRAKKAVILRRISMRRNECEVNGVRYRSYLAASKATGIHFHTVRYRCLSKNFPNYSVVTVT